MLKQEARSSRMVKRMADLRMAKASNLRLAIEDQFQSYRQLCLSGFDIAGGTVVWTATVAQSFAGIDRRVDRHDIVRHYMG
jgi:hypothetical protein